MRSRRFNKRMAMDEIECYSDTGFHPSIGCPFETSRDGQQLFGLRAIMVSKQGASRGRSRLFSFCRMGFLHLVSLLLLISNGYSQTEINDIQIVTPAWKHATEKDGTGLYFDIIRKVYQPFGIRLAFTIVPWKRAMKMITANEADALPGAYYMFPNGSGDLFPMYPIGGEVLCVLSKKGQVSQWEGQQSLAGKTLVWIRNYNYHKFLDVRVKWREIDRQQQGWRMVDSGRVDFYMENYNVITQYMKEKHVDTDRYDIHTVYTKALFLRFSNTDRSKKLIELYDSRMPELIDSGEIKALFDRWNFPYPSFSPRDPDH